jgi:hypothetical protein
VRQLSPEGRALLQRARTEMTPGPKERSRIERGVAAQVGVAAGSATLVQAAMTNAAAGGVAKASVAGAPALFASLKWITAVAVAGGVGIAGLSAYRAVHAPTDVAPAAAPAAEVPAIAREAPATAPSPTASEDPRAESAASASPVPVRAAPVRPVRAPRPASSPAARGSVAEEARLLRDANAALHGGDSSRALELLDEHRRAHPKGALSEESAAQRVFALCRAGRVADARQAALRFLQTHPNSPLVRSIRESCGSKPLGG